jgi:uncharacterized protein YlzI (FlbEa/FlbD family)
MIKLTKVGGEVFYLNERYIESIEATSDSDTTVKVHSGTTFVTTETPDQILDEMLKWEQSNRSRIRAS